MKKIFVMSSMALLLSAMPADTPITREGDTTVVNTTTLAKDVEGYNGRTPVKIYIKKDKIVKVEALPNHESPQYLAKAKAVLKKFEGKQVSKIKTLKVDAVTGATFTSEALVKNVKKGVAHYQEKR